FFCLNEQDCTALFIGQYQICNYHQIDQVGVKRWLAHLGCLLLVVKDEKEEGIRGHILPMAPELCKICRSWAM
ncbi:Os02g0555200, partial [Oryza sativa Japonica Group]